MHARIAVRISVASVALCLGACQSGSPSGAGAGTATATGALPGTAVGPVPGYPSVDAAVPTLAGARVVHTDPLTASLPGHAQGAWERAKKAVEALRDGASDPARLCGVVGAARNIPELASGAAPPEIEAALADGEQRCARDAWLAAAAAQLARVEAGDARACAAATAALARVADEHRADAETTALTARVATACPAP